jgi:hypothetical protein
MAAPTCESETSQVDYRQSKIYRLEAVSEEFTAGSLSDRNLEAFEFKAVEKLMDYADYMGIIYSERYEASFRQQARQNISTCFNSAENAEIALHPDGLSGSYKSFIFRVDSVEIIDPLQRETNTRYSGNMWYVEDIFGSEPAETTLIGHSRKTIEIILQMDYKDFGENSLLVWEILLGKITALD